jgi:hypothetical protein
VSEFVRADQVAEAIREWAGRPPSKGDNWHSDFSAYQRLAFESGVLPRRIYAILNDTQRFVTFSIADRLLTAIDRNYLLANGTIEVLQGSGARPPLDHRAEVG